MTDREIDALVAEKVMGWTDVFYDSDGIHDDGNGASCDFCGTEPHRGDLIGGDRLSPQRIPAFSTTWAGTGLVVEEMIGREPPILFSLEYGPDGHDVNGWLAVFTVLGFSTRIPHFSGNPSAPRAVCLAALKAVGVEVEE